MEQHDQPGVAIIQHREIEVKYTVNPSLLPEGLRLALFEGKEHPDIIRKGRITQLYLPLSPELIRLALSVIKEISAQSLTEADITFFTKPENIAELRILQREQDHLTEAKTFSEEAKSKPGSLIFPDAFQITLKGYQSQDGAIRNAIETPITTDIAVCRGVVNLLEALNINGTMSWREAVMTVEKMWYDIWIPNLLNGQKNKIVELDVFPDLDFLAIAEIEFSSREELDDFKPHLPPWFGIDITHVNEFKVRNLAGKTVDELPDAVQAIFTEIRPLLQPFSQPTVLGDEIRLLPKGIKDDEIVLVGSFKRWLPQFRRIGQDLARRAKQVYPIISTLDVARRQISNNDPGAAFRIEAEENDPLPEAEKNYLRRIRTGNAVYVISPEGRLGESSTEETIYGVSHGKKVFLASDITEVSKDLPIELRVLVCSLITEVLKGTPPFKFSSIDVTPHVYQYIDKTFPPELLKKLARVNIRKLLSSSQRQDNKRKILEAISKSSIR